MFVAHGCSQISRPLRSPALLAPTANTSGLCLVDPLYVRHLQVCVCVLYVYCALAHGGALSMGTLLPQHTSMPYAARVTPGVW
jgi:hypothetical protein